MQPRPGRGDEHIDSIAVSNNPTPVKNQVANYTELMRQFLHYRTRIGEVVQFVVPVPREIRKAVPPQPTVGSHGIHTSRFVQSIDCGHMFIDEYMRLVERGWHPVWTGALHPNLD